MKVLVTGASGFVGKSVVKYLKLGNEYVVAASRSLNFCDADESFSITDYSAKDIWLKPLAGCDVVIHLAARVHVMHDKSSNPLEAFLEANLYGTINLANQAAAAGVIRFVFVSSIKANGEFTEGKAFVETDKSNPQDPYAISKWEAEKALRVIEKETGMQVVIVRPPLVYGAGVKANFASLLNVVNKKLPLPLASINAKRSLIYVDNLADAIIVCAIHPKAAGQTYLVSDGEDVSISQLIKKIAHALDKPSYLLTFPVSIMGFFASLLGKRSSIDRLTQSLIIDSSKIRQQLDWKPPFNMDQGLKITADWYLKSLKNKRD